MAAITIVFNFMKWAKAFIPKHEILSLSKLLILAPHHSTQQEMRLNNCDKLQYDAWMCIIAV